VDDHASLLVLVAWTGLFVGCIAGAIPGLFFFNKEWLGGYASWTRRMIRLAHVSFFGIGFINLSLALTASTYGISLHDHSAPIFLIVGAVAMPLVCYLSAWKPVCRHFFFIPAGAVSLGIGLFAWSLFT